MKEKGRGNIKGTKIRQIINYNVGKKNKGKMGAFRSKYPGLAQVFLDENFCRYFSGRQIGYSNFENFWKML